MSRKNSGKGKQKKVIENEEDEKEYIVEAIVDRRSVKLILAD